MSGVRTKVEKVTRTLLLRFGGTAQESSTKFEITASRASKTFVDGDFIRAVGGQEH